VQLILDVLPDVLKLWKNVLPSMLLEFWSGGLPTNVSIFGPKLGGKVSLAALVVRECATCLALGLLVVLL
jgi:hypothetical protein